MGRELLRGLIIFRGANGYLNEYVVLGMNIDDICEVGNEVAPSRRHF
jgi:hypothetical protein